MGEDIYTPGPWSVDSTDDFGTYRINEAARELHELESENYGMMEGDEKLAEFKSQKEIAHLRDEGNRRLIQAAPDLLVALEAVLKWQYGEDGGNDDQVLNIVADALAKAKGKEL